MRSCLFCLDPLFYAHLFPVDKKVSIKINDEMRADSQRNGELDIDQVKMFFLLHFYFYPNLIRKYRMNCCSSVLILENRMHIL